jgi:4,5-DOPA dioxygenase extradiol
LNQQTLSLSCAELSEKPLPVLFLGHGNPMNAIEDNEYRRSWVEIGAQFGSGQRWPSLISTLVFS